MALQLSLVIQVLHSYKVLCATLLPTPSTPSTPTSPVQELSYTQFWQLVAEGRVDRVRFYGPQQRSLLASLGSTAPDGARTVKVTVPPDPMLLEHLTRNNVEVGSAVADGSLLHRGFVIQVRGWRGRRGCWTGWLGRVVRQAVRLGEIQAG